MKKWKQIPLVNKVVIAIIIALIVGFLLLPKGEKFEAIYALLFTLITGGAYQLIPQSWFARFKRKEKNPLID